MKKELNIGLIGAGSFAAFAVKAFLKIEGVKIIAVADVNEPAGKMLSTELNAVFYLQYQELLENKEVELVYISTPPFLHYGMSQKALSAGKHVICEKPAALSASEAEDLQQMAKDRNLLYVVNLMQRYNPLFQAVKQIVQKNILGSFLHGFFENYATDENLGEQHWFWDDKKSGGIFIEHAVHFFDLFEGWLGEGKVVHALQLQRKNIESTIYDRVQATVLYEAGTVDFYHGFDQPAVLDRQEFRLVFERGDISLFEWVPVKIKLHGLLKNEELQTVKNLLGSSSIIKAEEGTQKQKVRGRFTDIHFDWHVTVEHGSASDKQDRYQQLLKDMLQDQWNWIADRKHVRTIDDGNAVRSVKMAEQTKLIAQNINY